MHLMGHVFVLCNVSSQNFRRKKQAKKREYP